MDDVVKRLEKQNLEDKIKQLQLWSYELDYEQAKTIAKRIIETQIYNSGLNKKDYYKK